MAPDFFLQTAVKGALNMLPPTWASPEAKAMIIAICLQESKLQMRRQVGGPARGYAQFEQGGGVTGVLGHPASAAYARTICASLDVVATPAGVYTALENNDVLTAAFARLLLFTLPSDLPTKENAEDGWQQYVAAWRPGKPHRETWDANFNHAWEVVQAAELADEQVKDAIEIKDAATALVRGMHTLEGLVGTLG